ncbi:N-alpha-acetyltransferase 38, NatC auxiliary subunit [Entomortierella parvispora]|uniref:N-alpha-acetyltransferase 38, NatC auxiliary subunit n=1 Tax=Entomortierella parvispora TaxID=205924 RepID=A0A9P3LXG4_9FUNG|nr:N-alpha-acetyltransferase 38, NatC auxiliary subunit [Entomortierella parvispora]
MEASPALPTTAATTASVEEEDPIMVAKLRSFLNRNTRIEITDGRLFVGQFMCIDHSKNIILAGAYESRPHKTNPRAANASEPSQSSTATTAPVTPGTSLSLDETISSRQRQSKEERRFVGLVMIPGHHIVKAEMDAGHLRGVDARISASKKFDLDHYLRG